MIEQWRKDYEDLQWSRAIGKPVGRHVEQHTPSCDCTKHTRACRRNSWGFGSMFRSIRSLFSCGIKARLVEGETEFHRHKWNAFVLILGSYREQLEGDDYIYTRRWFNRAYAFRGHKVFVETPTWMIYFHGPVINPNKE